MTDPKEKSSPPWQSEPATDHPAAGEEPHRRWWIWLAYLLLFVASIPWYLPQNSPARVWLGLPHWVVISLLATTGIALFTAFVVHRYWEEPTPGTDSRPKGELSS